VTAGSINDRQGAAIAGFVQIVEFQTSRIDEVQDLIDERQPTEVLQPGRLADLVVAVR
jgi:hypothetical protein